MIKRVAFSNEHLTFEEVANHHSIVKKCVYSFYNSTIRPEFIGYTLAELESELEERINEQDKSSCLSLLAALEALIRIDYLQRCYEKLKDDVSKKMRGVHREKGSRASLEDDILDIWRGDDAMKSVASQVVGAFKYRHWLAHGRYWVPKFGRNYDFDYLYALAAGFAEKMDT
jgi:hypothetical protein